MLNFPAQLNLVYAVKSLHGQIIFILKFESEMEQDQILGF